MDKEKILRWLFGCWIMGHTYDPEALGIVYKFCDHCGRAERKDTP